MAEIEITDANETAATDTTATDQNATPAPTAPADASAKSSVKDVTVDGYTFQIDTDVIDDVDNVDLVDKIENERNLKAIVEFLQKLLGQDGYDKLRAYYVEKDGKFKLSKLGEIYQAIFEQFDPKG